MADASNHENSPQVNKIKVTDSDLSKLMNGLESGFYMLPLGKTAVIRQMSRTENTNIRIDALKYEALWKKAKEEKQQDTTEALAEILKSDNKENKVAVLKDDNGNPLLILQDIPLKKDGTRKNTIAICCNGPDQLLLFEAQNANSLFDFLPKVFKDQKSLRREQFHSQIIRMTTGQNSPNEPKAA